MASLPGFDIVGAMLTRRGFVTTCATTFVARRAGAAVGLEPAAPPSIKSFAAPYPVIGSIDRIDAAVDKLLPPDAKIELLAEGFDWAEGPVWLKKDHALLFTDVPRNTIYRWREGKGVTVFMTKSGYDGDRKDLKEPGANGLALDPQGNLVLCQQGLRRIGRLKSWADPQGPKIGLADKYEGKRFNSPNDVIVHKTGNIFFTDPPYGLNKLLDDPEKELKFQGIFRLSPKGQVTLVSADVERPNGIAFDPTGKILYIGNSHGERPVVMAFDLNPDLSVKGSRVFFDATPLGKQPGRGGAFDGLTVDRAGNLWATGPGGVVILSPAGKHLGTLVTGQATANCELGDDGALYITADPYLLRVKTKARPI